MKNIFNLIALIFGIGQSTAQPPFTTYHFENIERCLSKSKTPKMNISLNALSKREFVNYMKSKNIICL